MDICKTGRLIAERRAALGLTQMDLAQQLHITDKAVSKWERGKSLPDVALLGQACFRAARQRSGNYER